MGKDDEDDRTSIMQQGYAPPQEALQGEPQLFSVAGGFPCVPFSLSRHLGTPCLALALSSPHVPHSSYRKGCGSKKSNSPCSAFPLLLSRGGSPGDAIMNKPRWVYFSEETKCGTSGVKRD